MQVSPSQTPGAFSVPDVISSAATTSATHAAHSCVTMEEVSHQFQLWRLSKSRRFEPIPSHLKEMVGKLLVDYSASKIAACLHLGNRMIRSIKKACGHHFVKSASKPAKSKRSQVSCQRISGMVSGGKDQNLQQDMTFIPFKLSSLQVAEQSSATSATNCNLLDDATTTTDTRATPMATCHIKRPGGFELIIHTTSVRSVIQGFLCYS
jgi:hypothetical protein